MFIELDQAIAAWGSREKAARYIGVSRQRIEHWIKNGLPWEAHTDNSNHPAAQLCAVVARKARTTQKALLSASIKHRQRGK